MPVRSDWIARVSLPACAQHWISTAMSPAERSSTRRLNSVRITW
jgi:hypothetical protein